MQASRYQEDIYSFVKTKVDNLSINAVAGSGKTHTLVECVKLIPTYDSVLVIAFNSSIRDELKERIVRQNTNISNYNGFGWRCCLQTFPSVKFNQFKTKDTIAELGIRENIGDLIKAVSLCKAYGIFDPKDINQDLFDFEIKNLDILRGVYAKCINNTRVMDFDDQLFQPIYQNLSIPKYDAVVVDEFQDTSFIQAEFVKRASVSRIITAGDPDQAIYGWRGASEDAMAQFNEEVCATELPLSVCYRCPVAVIREAKQYVPRIEEAPGASMGLLGYRKYTHFYKDVEANDMVICRHTLPLVQSVLELIKINRSAYVKDNDVGKGLIALVNKMPDNIDQLYSNLWEYYSIQSQRFGEKNPNYLTKLEMQVQTLGVLIENLDSTHELIKKIKNLFDEEAKGICHMTIHKAKGLQNPRVWILEPDRYKKEPKLAYVAVTRSQQELYYVT